MSELETRLRTDLTAAMKARDGIRRETLRMALSAITMASVAGEAHELSDADVLAVLSKEAKKRGDAAQVYDQAGRTELGDKERAEAAVLAEYLPQPLTDAELNEVVDRAITMVTDTHGERPGPRQMGEVMTAARALAAGKADGKRLAGAVKSRL